MGTFGEVALLLIVVSMVVTINTVQGLIVIKTRSVYEQFMCCLFYPVDKTSTLKIIRTDSHNFLVPTF